MEKRPCIENACEECVNDLLVEHMYGMQAATFEEAAKMMIEEGAKYFRLEKDDMAKECRGIAKLFEAKANALRLKQHEMESCTTDCVKCK